MKSRDSRGEGKKAEKSQAEAGKMPYHRIGKFQKIVTNLKFWKKDKPWQQHQ